MNALTDLGGKKGVGKSFIKDLNLKMSKPSFSIYGAAMIKDVLGVRIEGTFGGIQSYDTVLKKVAASTYGRYDRNLSFRSKISELQLAVEVHPLFFKSYDEDEAPLWSPYVAAGIGFFNFNPEAKLDGRWYALQPLHTEGQGFAEYPDRKNYKLTQLCIPLGVGVKYELGASINVRLEIMHRILFTDYLDDASSDYIDPALFNTYLSPARAAIAKKLYNRIAELNPNYIPGQGQRGNPKNNDSFFTVQLKFGMSLRTARVRS
jgi:hypothetical protein